MCVCFSGAGSAPPIHDICECMRANVSPLDCGWPSAGLRPCVCFCFSPFLSLSPFLSRPSKASFVFGTARRARASLTLLRLAGSRLIRVPRSLLDCKPSTALLCTCSTDCVRACAVCVPLAMPFWLVVVTLQHPRWGCQKWGRVCRMGSGQGQTLLDNEVASSVLQASSAGCESCTAVQRTGTRQQHKSKLWDWGTRDI